MVQVFPVGIWNPVYLVRSDFGRDIPVFIPYLVDMGVYCNIMFNQYGVNEAEGGNEYKFPSNNTCFIKGSYELCFDVERVLIGYLIGVMAALKAAYLYGEYASNHPIQIFEPWLMNFRSLADITIMLVGFILVVADAPFVDSRSLLTIYRTSRGNWYDGLCLYVLVQGIIYFALSLTASCIYTDSSWLYSKSMEVAMKQLVLWPSDKAIITWHLVAPDKTLIEGGSSVGIGFSLHFC